MDACYISACLLEGHTACTSTLQRFNASMQHITAQITRQIEKRRTTLSPIGLSGTPNSTALTLPFAPLNTPLSSHLPSL